MRDCVECTDMVEYNQLTDMTGGPNLRCVRVEPPLPQWFRVVVPDPGILGNTPPPPPDPTRFTGQDPRRIIQLSNNKLLCFLQLMTYLPKGIAMQFSRQGAISTIIAVQCFC